MAKAFDVVPHNLLLQKLEAYGIKGQNLKWLADFLSQRSQRVSIDTVLSTPCVVTSGVVQGSVIGPLLFLVYINDIPDIVVPPTQVRLFADDAKFFSPSQMRSHLAETVVALLEWCDTWRMSLAMEKCFVLHLGPSINTVSTNPDSQVLNVATSTTARDLGVIIDRNLTFSDHVASVASRASRVANLILRSFRSHVPGPYIKAYISYARPILEYASPVWSPRFRKDKWIIENIQKVFTRRVYWRCNLVRTDYRSRMTFLNLRSLEFRRVITDLLLVHDLVHQRKPHFNKFFSFLNSVTRGHRYRLSVPNFMPNTELARSHFAWRIHKIWNRLPENIAHIVLRNQFKTELYKLPDNILVSDSCL
jgi:ribonucleases P/MRP protein subunit RPP40